MKGVHEVELGQWPQRAYVIGDRRSYRNFMIDRCGGKIADHPPFPTGGGGSCQKLTSGHSCVFVICISQQDTLAELACTLAHEATHLMRWLLEHIGEKEPGTETQCYLVEHIVRHGLTALAQTVQSV